MEVRKLFDDISNGVQEESAAKKRGPAVILATLLMLALFCSAVLNILWILNILPFYAFYIGFFAVLLITVLINIRSVRLKERKNIKQQEPEATISRQRAAAVIVVGVFWLLSMILSFCKDLIY